MIGIWLAGRALADDVTVEVHTREDGDPVARAEVLCSLDRGAVAGSTDERGRITLDLPGPGPWTLEITADGYLPTSIEVQPPVAGPVKVWVARGAGPLEVVVEGLKPTADPSRHVVDGEQALETPGTLDDSVRLVQSLPGVTVQREYSPSSGDLSVRGSSPGDSRYYLDGVEIPYLYHYNQYASVFPATQIEHLELYPSTFSAHYGDSVGAIVEAESRLKPPDALHGGANLNFVMGGADLTGPLPQGWWFSASGRRSYLDLGGAGSDQYTVWPVFDDFALRVEHGDADDGYGFFALGAGDGYTRAAGELSVLDPLEASTIAQLDYRQGFQIAGARRQWSRDGVRGRLVGAAVHFRKYADLTGPGLELLDTDSLTSRLDLEGRKNPDLGWDAGYELVGSRSGLEVTPAGPDGLQVSEEAPALGRGDAVDDAALRLRAGLYGTAHFQRGPVRIMPGLRVDADSTAIGHAPAAELEPRASARWSIGERGMLKLGAGRYTQRPDPDVLIVAPGLPTTTSWQISGGAEEAIAGRWEVGVDLYRKWLRDPLVYPIDADPYASPRGDAYGVELVTRYRLRELFYLWGWVAAAHSTYRDDAGDAIPSDGDQALSGGLVVSWDVGHWNFGGRYRYASGLPFTPLDGSVYDAGRDQWIPIPGDPNSGRLPPYQKIDLRVAYTWQLRGWSWEVVAEGWYVPSGSAQLYPTWNYDYRQQAWVIGPSFLPLLGVRARF